MGLDWTWQGGAGGTWSAENWKIENAGAVVEYKNTPQAPSVTFSGSHWQVSGTWFFQTDPGSPALAVGDIVYAPGTAPWHYGRTTISGTTDDPSVYVLSRANSAATQTGLIARTGVNPTFDGVNGTVIVDDTYYMNSLIVKGNSNVILAPLSASTGTLHLNPSYNREAQIYVIGGNADIRVNITNAEGTNNKNMLISNNGSGTLKFTGNTIMAADGAIFTNGSAGAVTAFDGVTFTNSGGKWLRFNQGTYIFDGDNIKSHSGDLRFASDSGTTNAIINAGGTLRNVGGGTVYIAYGAFNANVSVAGLFDMGASQTQIAYGAGSVGVLNISGDGVVQNTAVVTVAYGAASSGTVNISGRGRMETGSYVQIGTGSSSRATLNISGTGSFIGSANANSNIELANHATSRVVVNVSDSGTFATGGDNKLRVGMSGTAIVNVSGNAYVRSSDLYVGLGGVGILNIDGGHVYNPNGKYLYLNNANDKEGTAGIINLNSGTLTVAGVGFGSNNDRSLTVSNTAQLNITGGVLELTANGNYGIHTGNYNASGENNALHTASDTQLNLGGGTISSAAAWTLGMNATLTGSNGSIKFRTVGTATVTGKLSGDGGLKVETGTLLVSGTAGGITTHTYKGQTIVDSGATLQLSNLAELTISLADLGGLAAFDGAGTLTINGKVTISDDLTQLNGDYQLIGADLLGATLTLNSAWLTDFTQSAGNTNQWLYNANNEIFFDKSTGILTLAQIPEPSALALIVTGGALLMALRRRK